MQFVVKPEKVRHTENLNLSTAMNVSVAVISYTTVHFVNHNAFFNNED